MSHGNPKDGVFGGKLACSGANEGFIDGDTLDARKRSRRIIIIHV